ncbi:MAG: hypothetical protein GX998_04475 [Firmicutes bacterium]|nr:hypothetical protein [Bacillota bacterium]
MRKLAVIAFFISVLFTYPQGLLAMEVGGQVDILWSGVFQGGGHFDGELTESLELELFLPPLASSEVRYGFLVTKPLQGLLRDNEASYFTKKLYIKHRFEHFHLTLGRQPISWSFGSLLNPVDYTLGAVALDEESSSKYTDALEIYIPVNWNSGVDMVVSFPGGFDPAFNQLKWGARGRFGIKGFDVTFNYVQEPSSTGAGRGDSTGTLGLASSFPSVLFPRHRVGATLKGDIGGFGVYGSVGRYFEEGMQSSTSYLVGADCSYDVDYFTKITMQAEYLGLQPDSLDADLKASLLKMNPSDTRLDLLLGRVSYPLDEFASISLLAVVNANDGSLVVGPSYQGVLPYNLELTLGGIVAIGREDTLFAPGGLIPRAAVSLGLSYAF